MNNYPIFNCWFCNGATKFAGIEGFISKDKEDPILYNRECKRCNTTYCARINSSTQQFHVYYIDITFSFSTNEEYHIKCRALNGTAFLEYCDNPKDPWSLAHWKRIDFPKYCFSYLTLEEILNKAKTYILFS